MQLIDVLFVGDVNADSFLVNNALTVVPLMGSVSPLAGVLQSAFGPAIFAKADSFTILSMGFMLPHQFTIGECLLGMGGGASLPLFTVTAKYSPLFTPFPIDSLGHVVFPIPGANYELSMGVYADMSLVPNTFMLFMNPAIGNIQISMVGVPASLNGETFHCIPFIKILHNLPLTTPIVP